MPTYAYACTECDHHFEIVQSFTDDSLVVCPECGGRLRKVFNSVGVVFKGSGFYRTDSRADGRGAPGAKAGGDQGSSASQGDKGSDSGASTSSSSSSSAPSTSSEGASSGSSSSPSGSSSPAGSGGATTTSAKSA